MLSQLKTVATATGINSSDTKSILSARLLEVLQLDRFSSPKLRKNDRVKTHRIISIDMGIRNLAYCRLAFPDTWTTRAKSSLPVVEDWTRIAISPKAELEDPPPESPATKAKEAFDPATYSQYAYNLVSTLLTTPPQPTQILIERQRFRSMGGASVQEWTLRVNMFEAMIYAVLKSFQEQGLWGGKVHPVAPGKVAKFWLGDSDRGDENPAKKSSSLKNAKTKAAKIDIVGQWLEDQSHFILEGKTAELGRAYLKKRQGRKRVMTQGKELLCSAGAELVSAEIGKLDDLADCLLQGMAWIRWEENRRRVLDEGLEALYKPRKEIVREGECAHGKPKNDDRSTGSIAARKQERKKGVGKLDGKL